MDNEIWLNENWKENLINYCNDYDIPIKYLVEVINDPKVIPMIRGKAFEFSVMQKLKEIIPQDEWIIEKPMINAQSGFHDIDIRMIHKKTDGVIRIECKLAKKESYKLLNDSSNQSVILVKCMRSRTLGERETTSRAPQLGIDKSILQIHNDQYLPQDFDIVITSIGNAFYITNEESGLYMWKPTKKGSEFLNNLRSLDWEQEYKTLKDFTFNRMYVVKSADLAVNKQNKVICTRRKCKKKESCGFIPNYPAIIFDNTSKPINNWIRIEDSLPIFQSFIEKSK